MNPELAKKPLEPLPVGVWRVETKNVDTVGGGELETRKYRDSTAFSSFLERRNSTHTVVVSDRKH